MQYKDVIVNLTNSEILALANNTFEVNHFTDVVQHVIPSDKLARATTVAVSMIGITGVFHKCSEYFSGPNCTTPVCFGISADDPKACNSSGICIEPNKCECWSFDKGIRAGSNCEAYICNELYTGNECNDLAPVTIVMIVVIVLVPCLCLLICIIILVSLCACRYKRVVTKQKHKEYEMENMLRVSLINADSLAAQIDRDWVIPLTDLVFNEIISEGSFGVVFKGVYQNLDV
jgi:hypothetical protein